MRKYWDGKEQRDEKKAHEKHIRAYFLTVVVSECSQSTLDRPIDLWLVWICAQGVDACGLRYGYGLADRAVWGGIILRVVFV